MKTIEELITEIEYNTGKFPKAQVKELIERKDESIPVLINILKDVPNNPDKYLDGPYYGHIYAAYLLAQFRVKEAFPFWTEILKLPGDLPDGLYGDVITEAGGRIAACMYNGDLSAIKEIIENDELDEFVRSSLLSCLTILVLNDILDRESIIEYILDLLKGKLTDRDSYALTSAVIALDDLYPVEGYEEIKKVFEADEVDESSITLEYIDETLKKSKEEVIKNSRKDHYKQLINDAISELSSWVAFHNSSYNNREGKNPEKLLNKKKLKERSKRKAAKQQKKKNRKK